MEMETVANTEFYDILVDKDNSILVYRWKETILDLNEEEYKEGFLEALKYLEEYRPVHVIHDSRTQVYPITPELQKWIMNEITPRFKAVGVKKIAYVMPKDFLSKLALEQLVLKLISFKQGIKRMYFDDFDAAVEWMKK